MPRQKITLSNIENIECNVIKDVTFAIPSSYLSSSRAPSGDAERVDVPRRSVLRRGRRHHELYLPRAAEEKPDLIHSTYMEILLGSSILSFESRALYHL